MEKTKIACVIIGAMGRMGQRLCQLSVASDDVVLAGGTESHQNSCVGKTLKEIMGLGDGSQMLVGKLEEMPQPFDAVIDFTFPGCLWRRPVIVPERARLPLSALRVLRPTRQLSCRS